MTVLKRFLKGVGLSQVHLGMGQEKGVRERAMFLKPAGLSGLQKRFFQIPAGKPG